MQGLKNIREAKMNEGKRYTQAAVAKAVGITPPTMRVFERDPSKIPMGVAAKMADYLDCDVDDIFFVRIE